MNVHTHTYDIPGYGKVHVNVNSDWSGEAIIFWTDDGQNVQTRLPALLLFALGEKAAKTCLRQKIDEVIGGL